jgi:hypothetical protein
VSWFGAATANGVIMELSADLGVFGQGGDANGFKPWAAKLATSPMASTLLRWAKFVDPATIP